MNVVVIPGSPLSSRSVRPIVNALEAAGFETDTFALSDAVTSADRTRARLEKWVAARGLRKFGLVGHSFGAYRALDFALESDASVAAVCAIGPMPGLPEGWEPQMEQLAGMVEGGANPADLFYERWFSERHRSAHPDSYEQLQSWCSELSSDVAATQLREYATGERLTSGRLARVDCPVQLLVGELDEATPVDWARHMHEALPHSELEIVPEAGHFVFIERPPSIDRVVEFFAQHQTS